MVNPKYYLIKDGVCYFNDFLLEVDGFAYKKLLEIRLGEKTTHIKERAFEHNYLRSVTFYKKVKFIESRAFANNKIEKLVFNRIEVPFIAKDAFVGNPLKLIIVPYESLQAYKDLLRSCEIDENVEIVSNIEVKFEELNATKKENEVMFVKALSIYGDYIWRIEKMEKADFVTRLNKDHNQNNFFSKKLDNGIEYDVHRTDHGNVTIYRQEGAEFIDLTMDDFVNLVEEKSLLC